MAMTNTQDGDRGVDVPLPEPLIRGTASSRCISDIMRPRDPRDEHMFHPGQEQLGFYYLPPFQRPASWTPEQSARLIESIFLGVSIGSITVSACREPERVVVDGRRVEMFPFDSEWLIDGQQRLRALDAYLADRLTVFAGTPHEHRWSDLSRRQQRFFMSTSVGFTTLGETDVDGLKRIYDLMNFGGTAHTEDQRAVAG